MVLLPLSSRNALPAPAGQRAPVALRRHGAWLLALLALGLAGCDQLGIESASALAARKEAEGKAIGAGCRHAARSVEQCYVQNKRADKAAVFAGWKEMNDYMRENKIEAVPPPPPEPADGDAAHAEEPAAAGKAGAKAGGAKH